MDWPLYFKLSVMMFLEYAIWGAWSPVLAARLLGPLKMSGKQTGWIYATLPLACIISPLIAGQLADQWFAVKWILVVAHLIGAVLLFAAARQQKFAGLFPVMLFYSLCYAATLPLVNALMFQKLAENNLDIGKHSPNIFIWAPIAWALVGYSLTGWRWKFKTGEQGRDCLYLAAILSVIMAVSCLFLPDTPPAKSGKVPIVEAMAMLGNSNFLIFIVISMVVAGMMQFYFLGTARFMQDMGIPPKNVPASMAIAQAVQAIATFFALGYFLVNLEFKWTLTVGAVCWLLMYIVYVGTKPRWLIVLSQSLHGLAYVFFIIAGQILAEKLAPEEIRNSMQALIFAATVGVGLFFGTQFAGVIMDKFRKEDKFQWRQIFLVPCVITLVCVVAFVLLFTGPAPDTEAQEVVGEHHILSRPPQGFVALFNGKDLTGWKGLVGDPVSRAKMDPQDLEKAQVKADEQMRAHWNVVDGVLVFDGKGHSLCTAKDYGDFELLVDWKIEPGGDSGLYLRGSPQVQIWDPAQRPEGSGGLFNNKKGPSKPLKCADNPVGRWNAFRIIMTGEKVTVYLNDVLVMDNVVLENYWEPEKPIYPVGQIELQSHGSLLYFSNIFIREIPTT